MIENKFKWFENFQRKYINSVKKESRSNEEESIIKGRWIPKKIKL